MKNFIKYFFIFSLMIFGISSCNNDYIDPITPVSAGTDQSAPVITLLPVTDGITNGMIIDVPDPFVNRILAFQAKDDIELKEVTVSLNGSQIASYNTFTDYRIFIQNNLPINNIVAGNYIITIVAKDKDGHTTTMTVNFQKKPYTPYLSSETLYMPFDGNFYDLISLKPGTAVGNVGFAGISKIGTNSLMAQQKGYLTFPSAGLMTPEFSASFWYKVNASPDRAGIITIGANNTDRTQGFRLFREGGNLTQGIKLNVGTGSGESWNTAASISATSGEWVHIAFTISATQNVVYINGAPASTATMSAPINWTGCTSFSIASGEPTFAYWNHLSDLSDIDDLKFYNKALTASEVASVANSAYVPPISDETLYMNFDNNYLNLDNSGVLPGIVGSPSYAGISHGGTNSYKGAADSYLTYPITGLFGTKAFSTTFWYKVNPAPDRAGILVVGASTTERMQGFRLFREGNATTQRIKLNVGTGTGESWNDGGEINATTGKWVLVAVTVSPTESKIYFDGVLMNTATYTSSIDWTGCTTLVIGSGGPTFAYWDHKSDLSAMDDLRIYKKVLTQAEIQSLL